STLRWARARRVRSSSAATYTDRPRAPTVPTVGYCSSEANPPVAPYAVTTVASAAISVTANCGAAPHGSRVAVLNATTPLRIWVVTASRTATADVVLNAYMVAM